jgi:hypothetical protein
LVFRILREKLKHSWNFICIYFVIATLAEWMDPKWSFRLQRKYHLPGIRRRWNRKQRDIYGNHVNITSTAWYLVWYKWNGPFDLQRKYHLPGIRRRWNRKQRDIYGNHVNINSAAWCSVWICKSESTHWWVLVNITMSRGWSTSTLLTLLGARKLNSISRKLNELNFL